MFFQLILLPTKGSWVGCITVSLSDESPFASWPCMNRVAWHFISSYPVKWENSNQTLKCLFLLLKTFLNCVAGYSESELQYFWTSECWKQGKNYHSKKCQLHNLSLIYGSQPWHPIRNNWRAVNKKIPANLPPSYLNGAATSALKTKQIKSSQAKQNTFHMIICGKNQEVHWLLWG